MFPVKLSFKAAVPLVSSLLRSRLYFPCEVVAFLPIKFLVGSFLSPGPSVRKSFGLSLLKTHSDSLQLRLWAKESELNSFSYRLRTTAEYLLTPSTDPSYPTLACLVLLCILLFSSFAVWFNSRKLGSFDALFISLGRDFHSTVDWQLIWRQLDHLILQLPLQKSFANSSTRLILDDCHLIFWPIACRAEFGTSFLFTLCPSSSPLSFVLLSPANFSRYRDISFRADHNFIWPLSYPAHSYTWFL